MDLVTSAAAKCASPPYPGGRLAARRVAVNDDDLGAAFGEGERRGAANAVPGTGDQRDLAGKVQIHRVPPDYSVLVADVPGPSFEGDEQIANEPAPDLVGETAGGVKLGLRLADQHLRLV